MSSNDDNPGFIRKVRPRGRMSTFTMVVMVVSVAVGSFWIGMRGREQAQAIIFGPEQSREVPSAPTYSPNAIELN